MRILGIDPGYERLGIAILEKIEGEKETTLLYSACFKTSPKIPFEERLMYLGEEVERVIGEYSPQVLSIERLFFTNNQKTATNVAEARGVIIYEAKRAELEVFQFTPLQVKVALSGYGRASKAELTKMVHLLIKIPKKIAHDDEYDAIALGLTYLANSNFLKNRLL